MMNRSEVFDSLKFILIFLVVVGHVIERNLYHDNRLVMMAFSFIYSFHMPLFIFISGYFTKTLTWEKYKKSFVSIFVTYIIFQILFSIRSIVQGEFDVFNLLTKPSSVLWYIIGLLCWRFVFCFIPKDKKLFPIILIISLICGYSINYVLDQDYFYTRIVSFFPYFVLGYYCSGDIIEKIRSINKDYSVLFLIGLSISLYFYTSYNLIFSFFGGTPLIYESSLATGLLYMTISYSLAIVTSICVINLATPLFHKLGSTTLTIYLIHPFYIYYMYNLVLRSYDQNPGLGVDIIVSAFIVLISLLVAKIPYTQYLVDPVGAFSRKKGYAKNSNIS